MAAKTATSFLTSFLYTSKPVTQSPWVLPLWETILLMGDLSLCPLRTPFPSPLFHPLAWVILCPSTLISKRLHLSTPFPVAGLVTFHILPSVSSCHISISSELEHFLLEERKKIMQPARLSKLRKLKDPQDPSPRLYNSANAIVGAELPASCPGIQFPELSHKLGCLFCVMPMSYPYSCK